MSRRCLTHRFSLVFFTLLFHTFFSFCNTCGAQHFTDLVEPETVIQGQPATATPVLDEGLPEPISGRGRLTVSIESFKGANLRRVSQLADRVEIWLGDKRLAALNHSDIEVVKEKNRRIFLFPEISLNNGYYFLTVRLYSQASLYGRDKWHGEIFQVGIHPDKISRVYKKIPFFHY
ncbi:MAG: hypothetical protein KKB51_14580 [Candidatus Riflebacteria bacterium]|nr:hypothetical protein [Candidatus Riflebacteria bacterium]